ncbi:unnamed protein product [Didymodactylos carnosus]|uniref:Uncharacterized protein n=1 Tax=Didymodactylos carnosus TaxID=1234261 RepID=A0A814DBD3_9BILA|nr:unnamed protein product [Didymodactylos carnosus]CAF3730057.1 unnamed protein product [Didymodactylos carnosus]
MQLRLQRSKRKAPITAKPNRVCLRLPAAKQEFQIVFSNRFAMLEPSEDIDTEEKQISAAIIECAIPLCPPIWRRTQQWTSDECLDLVEKRKKAKHADFEEYRRLNKEVRKKLKEEREAYWNQVAAEMEEAASKHEYRTLYQTIRRLGGKTKSTNDNIKKADGTFAKSSEERLQRWKEFFQQLYNHDRPQGPLPEPPPIVLPANPFLNDEPTAAKVKSAIKSLKNVSFAAAPPRPPGADMAIGEHPNGLEESHYHSDIEERR